MKSDYIPVRNSEMRFFATLGMSLVALFLIAYVINTRIQAVIIKPTQTASASFPQVALTAKAAYVYDLRTHTVLYSQNPETRMPLASLTKVMSALVAEDLSPVYGTVTISKDALTTDGDSGLKPGEKWSLQNLLDFSLTSSSNDGIHAIALSLGALASANATPEQIESDFVKLMNRKADELDLTNTYYWNETGLDVNEYKGGAYGTAHDMTTLMSYVLKTHPDLMAATRDTETIVSSLDNIAHKAKNTNLAAASIPNLLASKTGYTDTAGGNLVFAFDPELGRPIIISILGSTESGRFEDAKILVNATLNYLKSGK